jgi:hypothetical protein
MGAMSSGNVCVNPGETGLLADAWARFDEENGRDPNIVMVNGVPEPHELHYARRLTDWVLRICPFASEALRLAARCQHLCRWEIPRSTYEGSKVGYLRWRNDLKVFHAHKAGEILREVGYPEEVILKVQALNLKKNFPADPDSRVLEDALCLVFLEFQFAELAAKTTDEKMVNALQKCWKKMTSTAHAEALKLHFGENEKRLVQMALS